MKSKEPSQAIDDILLDEKSAEFDADDLFDLETNENSDITASCRNTHTVTNTAENKAVIPYIISESNLFDAMGIYSNYKEYTNSVISEEDMLLNEIYEKFVEM